ncbi:hypothetical protein OHB00_08655 [Streptomyces sp. NBC_00631]|uniref:hypothetical protein n=1 Tax=Streptomyces sp. NBC_00631 TaxID=2975793 RepID=UPI0030E4AF89
MVAVPGEPDIESMPRHASDRGSPRPAARSRALLAGAEQPSTYLNVGENGPRSPEARAGAARTGTRRSPNGGVDDGELTCDDLDGFTVRCAALARPRR